MLWKETLKELRHAIDCSIDQNEAIAKELLKMQEEINQLKNYKDALITALQNDRKDINILIQMVKNNKKGKK